MSRRVSVMIEVGEEVYDCVVEPMKKNKSFAKLISSLLNGYIHDGYVRALVDDNLEEVKKAVVGSFEDSVGEMESVLANMGLFTDELHAQTQAGHYKFQQQRNRQAEQLGNDPIMHGGHPPQKDTEVEELRGKVEGLERTVSEGFNRLFAFFESGKFSTNVGVNDGHVVEDKSSVQRSVDNIISGRLREVADPIPLVPTVKSAPAKEAVGGFHVQEEKSSSEANSFLSSLIADFGAGF